MPTLQDYRREMLRRHPALGRILSPTAVAAQSVTVAGLATGEAASAYINKWLVRPESASVAADRERLVSAFATATGALTHAGSAYTDTTLGTETAELLEYRAWLFDDAINTTLQRLRRIDRTEFPTRNGTTRYSLADLSWVASPSDVSGIAYRRSKALTHDRYVQKWNTVNTAGALQPDWWTLSGAGASVTRSSTQKWKGNQTAKLVRSGADVTLSQPIPLLINGTAVANGEDLRGKTVTAVLVGWASAATTLRVSLTDGATTANSSYHSGGSTFEELTASMTFATTATPAASISVQLNTTDTTAYVAEAYPIEGELSDSTRRDAAVLERIDPPWEFDQGTPISVELPATGRGAQYVFSTSRGYPAFDATRLAAGTADADSSDAPLLPVAVGAIARLYEAVAELPGQDGERARRLAAQWDARFQREALAHFYREETTRGGIDLPRMTPMAPMARSGGWR